MTFSFVLLRFSHHTINNIADLRITEILIFVFQVLLGDRVPQRRHAFVWAVSAAKQVFDVATALILWITKTFGPNRRQVVDNHFAHGFHFFPFSSRLILFCRYRIAIADSSALKSNPGPQVAPPSATSRISRMIFRGSRFLRFGGSGNFVTIAGQGDP